MRLPTSLLCRNRSAHKNDFGHVLILAGSRGMMGAGALTSLAAMRAGAGLVTLGVPESLNAVAQKKISFVVMTWPLAETKEQTLAPKAFLQISKHISSFQVLAIGPGLSTNKETQNFILKVISNISIPMVIDADALNALSLNINVLKKSRGVKILTPHAGEMARLIKMKKETVAQNRQPIAVDFAHRFNCTLLLKGYKTVVASPDGKVYLNTTGNAGMATAGSGDVLTGMIAAFLAQGLSAFDAAKFGAYLHGTAGDMAQKKKATASLIATDIIDNIPNAFIKSS